MTVMEIIQQDVPQIEVLSAESTKKLIADLDAKENLLKEYSKKADAAAIAAEAALNIANEVKSQADIAKGTAGKDLKFKLFGKKDAIIDVKDRVKAVAEVVTQVTSSQVSLAKAQSDLAKAEKESLACQKKLAEISLAMVQLGCTSIANSRIVVRQLEARLEGATQEELNDLARAELNNVINQIRDQQDALSRQDQLERIVHGLDETQRESLRIDAERDKAIVEQMQKGLEHDKKISAQARRSEEHHRILLMQTKRNDEIDRTLKQHKEISESIQKSVSINSNRVEAHGRLLEQNVQVIKALDERILFNRNLLNEHSNKLDIGSNLLRENSASIEKHTEQFKESAEQIEEICNHIQHINESLVLDSDRLCNHDDEINSIRKENEQHSIHISNNGNRIEELEADIAKKAQEIELLQRKIIDIQNSLQAKTNNTLSWIIGGVSAVALILSILQFLI